MMLEAIPDDAMLLKLVCSNQLQVFKKLCQEIELRYDTVSAWDNGGRKWTYECKYRLGGKTLCALYFKPLVLGFMVIFGQDERERLELARPSLPAELVRFCDEAQTYHDGKWVMFLPSMYDEAYMRLLAIKRKPRPSIK
jgi:hypothetical protein